MGIQIPRKRIIVPTIAAVAVLGIGGGVAWAVTENDERLTGSQGQRAEEAALAEVGGGRVLEAEVDDDGGNRHYELEVVDTEGTAWDVVLDEAFQVVVAAEDDRDDDRYDDRDDGRYDDRADVANDGAEGSREADEQPVTAEERQRVGAAAAGAVPGGKAVDVDRSDDAGTAWEVEVRDAQGRDWDVTLDAQLAVLDSVRD
ncbi:PepSY domain-containing protein [Nocardioides sp.]|uniref:PepSY domain-containing protein n=1 Tax=Nocardioides sp. TaxID=35761 RepID=UPI002C58FD61|nr:PepSY domain-containing protein [Nocardioides sp.]HSX69279.1 PepSY domain-containing protein [Nocardioides sp.]